MLAATAAGLAGAAGLAWLWRDEQRRAGDGRERLFERACALLQEPAIERRRPDYPVLRGRWRGQAVELRPVSDALATRKLPALWLQVSLLAPTGAPGTLDALLRPLGGEFWSPADGLAASFPTPTGLPSTVRLRADGPAAAGLLPVVQRHAAFLERPDAKELLITPKGVRLVVLLAEGERGAYLLLRQARFALDRLDAAVLRALLDRAHALHRDVVGLARRAAA